MTTGWLVYQVGDMELRVLGIYETEDKARGDASVCPLPGEWLVMAVPFVGWGFIKQSEKH